MSKTTASLQRQIKSAGDLQSVVRTMKALAASNIGQYETAVRALGDYHRSVELGLSVCLRSAVTTRLLPDDRGPTVAAFADAIVFGSDQGLVGRFNDSVADFAATSLGKLSQQRRVWAVGERVHGRLADAGIPPTGLFTVPTSVKAITALVGEILEETETLQGESASRELYLFHNRPMPGATYGPIRQRLLPLDQSWRGNLVELPWPTSNLPEVVGGAQTLRALIREYLFVSLFRTCAESLASENASRMTAMQRADKNIDELVERLNGDFHRLRQSGIDAELFDVTAGFEALRL